VTLRSAATLPALAVRCLAAVTMARASSFLRGGPGAGGLPLRRNVLSISRNKTAIGHLLGLLCNLRQILLGLAQRQLMLVAWRREMRIGLAPLVVRGLGLPDLNLVPRALPDCSPPAVVRHRSWSD